MPTMTNMATKVFQEPQSAISIINSKKSSITVSWYNNRSVLPLKLRVDMPS